MFKVMLDRFVLNKTTGSGVKYLKEREIFERKRSEIFERKRAIYLIGYSYLAIILFCI